MNTAGNNSKKTSTLVLDVLDFLGSVYTKNNNVNKKSSAALTTRGKNGPG